MPREAAKAIEAKKSREDFNASCSIPFPNPSEIDPRIAKLAPLMFIVPINYFVLSKLVFKKKA